MKTKRTVQTRKYNILFTILVILGSLNLNSEPKNNQIIKLTKIRYVNTINGSLRLRSMPNIDSKIIAQIPNQKEVEILKFDDSEVILNNITGKWVKVKYNGFEGWVFDGYLIKIYNFYPEDESMYFQCNSEDSYLNKFKRLEKRKNLKIDKQNSETKKYEDSYEENITSMTTVYLGGAYSTVVFPDKSIKDVFEFYKECDPKLKFVDYDEKNNQFQIEFRSESFSSESYKFEYKNNKTFVLTGGQA
ncbi:SH3 domain-containing protein [Leptospira sp. WS4.C2]